MDITTKLRGILNKFGSELLATEIKLDMVEGMTKIGDQAISQIKALVVESLGEELKSVGKDLTWGDTGHNSNAVRYGNNQHKAEMKQKWG